MLLLKFIEFSQAFVVPSAPSLYDKSLTIPYTPPPPQKKRSRVRLSKTTPQQNSAGYVLSAHAKIPKTVMSRSGSVGARW